jgi:hypothetical protein
MSKGKVKADILLLPGWQAFIAGTSFGAGYTLLFCVSITTDYESQDWYVADWLLLHHIGTFYDFCLGM